MSTFGWDSTTDEVTDGVDLSAATVVITGSSSGIGVETARALAARGARIIGAARSGDKSAAAAEALRVEVPGAEVDIVDLDLGSLASVRACAQQIHEIADTIDVLINNAGVMATPHEQTTDGFERQFGTNHLGHFLLTRELVDLLANDGGGRVVCLSSAGHWSGQVDLDDPNYHDRPYEKWEAYGQSKTANALHAHELSVRYRDEGISALSVHPGVIMTNLARYLTEQDLMELMTRTAAIDEESDDDVESKIEPAHKATRLKTIPQGAATTVWAAVTPDIEAFSGSYCEDCAPAEPQPAEDPTYGYAPWARDPETATALWGLSERLVDP
jgi:NAD(P)-dependent dehydrogenase (short-subunit alcohol dehydrogenase family)